MASTDLAKIKNQIPVIKPQDAARNLVFMWLRRDLRLEDNRALFEALNSDHPVLPVFIFDARILAQFSDPQDRRVAFIWLSLQTLQQKLKELGKELLILYGDPEILWGKLIADMKPKALYVNHDYEPAAIARDLGVQKICEENQVEFFSFKDHVFFEKSEVLSDAKKPYTVFTPYKRKWLTYFREGALPSYPSQKKLQSLVSLKAKLSPFPYNFLGYAQAVPKDFPALELSPAVLKNYARDRDFPALEGTSQLGVHLRFGTISIRSAVKTASRQSEVWLSELIWRDFFSQILFHFPVVVERSFRPEYENIKWRENVDDFRKWCEGRTGYDLVDAGMRELNQTGYMHNRVRMVAASFLCKHLLIHWKKGEAYFAQKLLDYDLASNNGNWQWAAGTGCDAAPYFRIFNPITQAKKFDPDSKYIEKWNAKHKSSPMMVEHKYARERALVEFARGIKSAQEQK